MNSISTKRTDLNRWVEESIKNNEHKSRQTALKHIDDVISEKAINIDLHNLNLTSLPQIVFYFKNLVELNINGNKLKQLPTSIGLLTNLKNLYANNNEILSIPYNIKDLKKLEVLGLDDNKIKTLHTNIGDLTSLRSLFITNNNLKELPASIGMLKNLTKLFLNNNSISLLPETIKGLKKLEVLSLMRNKIKNLPNSIAGLISLQTILLDGNQLTGLPFLFGKLKKLKTFQADSNKIINFPEVLTEISSLETLSLDNNSLAELPLSIGLLKNLQNLYVHNNKLASLPETISSLDALRILNVNFNNLRELPSSFGQLKNLKELYLNNNKLFYLHDSLTNLNTLNCLCLENNNLRNLPMNIGNLTSLKHLYIKNNNLQYLPVSINQLLQLENIELDADVDFMTLKGKVKDEAFKWHLKTWNSNAFPRNKNAKIIAEKIQIAYNQGILGKKHCLFLSNLGLEEIPEPIKYLTELTCLFLNDNKIKKIPNWISNLKNLFLLQLNSNHINCLPLELTNLQALRILEVSHNNINKLLKEFTKLDVVQNITNRETLKEFVRIHLFKWIEQEKSLNEKANRIIAARDILKSFDKENFQENHTIDLSHSHLNSLPDILGKISTLKSLNISNNNLSYIPESFKYLKRLNELDITNNKFDKFPPIIDELGALLIFRHDDIQDPESIPKTRKKQALLGKNFTSINNFYTMIEDLRDWTVKGDISNIKNRELVELKIKKSLSYDNTIIDFSDLKLTSLPDIMFQFTKLTYLNLSNNKINTIPSTIENLKELTHIDLHNNEITSIPNELGKLQKLKNLNLARMRLENFPNELCELKSLEALHLNDNPLSSLPTNLGHLQNLTEIYLDGLGLEECPESIYSLRQLKILSASRNKLQTLRRGISRLTNLQELLIHSNNLTVIDSEIGQLTKLECINLNMNENLDSLPMSLGNCSLLNQIDCLETKIPPDELVALHLRIKKISLGVFQLQNRLSDWMSYSGRTFDLRNLWDESKFDDKEQNSITMWLQRLEDCSDFNTRRRELALLTCEILSTLSISPSFKEQFFSQLSGNLEACGDRAAMLFNLIFTEWKLHNLPKNATIHEKIQYLVPLAKTLTLRNVIREMIETYETTHPKLNESVEIYLWFETQLKPELGLLTAISRPLYLVLGNRTDVIKRDVLKQRVEDEYLDTLVNLSSIEDIIKQIKDINYSDYNNLKDKITQECTLEMDKLDDDEALGSEKYRTEGLRIMNKRSRKISELRKQFLQHFLYPVIAPKSSS